MANEFTNGKGIHSFMQAMKELGIQLFSSAGTPTSNGPAKGALCVDTTNAKLYINAGTATSATWNSIGDIAASEISLAQGSVLVGNASGVGVALDGKADGKILVGNATTMTSVSVSGDATLANTGALTVTDVTVGSDAAGDILYKSSATALARLAKGSAGQVMVMNSGATAPSWASMSGDATIASTGVLTIAEGSIDGLEIKKVARATYDFAEHGGAVGTISLGVSLPDNAIITRSWYEVLTTLTSAGDLATISLDIPTDDVAGIVAATAINAGGNIWDAGLFEGIQTGTVANFSVKTTAARALSATIGVEDVTAGKFILFCEYVVSD